MSKALTLHDLDEQIRSKVYTQDYTPKSTIHGVRLVDIVSHSSEEGDFAEIIRVRDNGETEEFPGFKIAQVNRSLLLPDTAKGWHLHLKHDEIWYLMPNQQLFIGLWDVRVRSKTNGVVMRISLGGTKRLLFIPQGVAHGAANLSRQEINLFYFVNQRFDSKNPDEKRIPWDALGSDFWTPKRD